MKTFKLINWIVGIVYYLWALLFSLAILRDIFIIFESSWKIGLALFLTGIGEMIFMIPIVILWGGFPYAISIGGEQEKFLNKILYFLGICILAVIISWSLRFAINFLLGITMYTLI